MLLYTPYARLNIDRSMVALLALFVFLGACLVTILIIATNSLAALRSYSTMQTHWTESRKEATYQIIQYAETGDPAHKEKYADVMKEIAAMTKVRLELQKEETNNSIVRRNLVQAHMLPVEIDDMITTYERFSEFGDFKLAVHEWEQSDSLVYLYDGILSELERTPAPELIESTVDKIEAIDGELTQVQYALSAALTSGTGFLNQVILWMALSLGGLLLVISSVFSFRFLKSLKKWHRKLSVSQQRYKSLYEQNPNAVFSMDEDGVIQGGNKMFKRNFKSEYTGNEALVLSDLIKDRTDDEVDHLLDRVRHEQSLGFLTALPRKKGGKAYFYMMLMPIIVDEEIRGIFAVAEDVTFQKKAETKIKDQLKEKSVLLAEIHHRVKNNLAVISGLLELQQGKLKNDQAIHSLEEAKGRIKSMAMIHEQIYQNENLSDINFQDYILKLSDHVKQTYAVGDQQIELNVEAKNIGLTLDQTIPCGLIINELLSNAYKYAFDNREEGNIWIRVEEEDQDIKMVVADDGVGLPNDWREKLSDTLGLTLVQILTEQLDGELTMKSKHATHFEITFEKQPVSNGFLHKNNGNSLSAN